MKVSRTKTLNQLVKMVCAKEGGKKKLDAPQARESLFIIKTLLLNDSEFLRNFLIYIYFK